MAKLKVGMIGAGAMGRAHGAALKEMDDVEIVGLWSKTAERAQSMAEGLGTRAFDRWEDLLKADIEAVWVLTPDHVHHDPAIAALENGKHLFLEKSLERDYAKGKAIVEAGTKATAKGQKVLVAYPLRLDPRYQHMKRLVDDPTAGAPAMAWSSRTHFLTSGSKMYDKYRDEWYLPPSWYFEMKKTGGPLYSHASHDYDLLQWLFGPIERVSTYGGTVLDGCGDIPLAYSVNLRFANGAVGSVTTPWITRVEYDYIAVACREMSVFNLNGELVIQRADGPKETLTFGDVDLWHRVNRHFVDCCSSDQVPACTLADGLQAIAVATAAVRSLQEEREVWVEEQP